MENKNIECPYNYDYLKQRCHKNRIQIVLDMIKNINFNIQPNILSVGCGDGTIEKDFPGKVQGLDKFVHEKTYIPVKKGYLEYIPFSDKEFDIIFLGEILEHVYDTHKSILETNRVLKNGGYLILTTPNAMNFRDRIRSLFGVLPRQLTGYLDGNNAHLYEHIRHFSKNSLKSLLEKNGFKIIKFSSSAININLFGSKPIDLYKIARFIPSLGNNLICIAIKKSSI